ncbi:hypothetical protein CAOG_00740 [Capsaspora owczarzaki ATCC 30864]|uniref:hypothetical protein n=1 Tax=Capsaspora owczarzaki (strain ATCC 30864) TaxID=595528 RepID=UPI0003522F66|nr:hypothetical protein CAOG_00740 [Capsaspora owczarzaki ATCC 30864]|eukprot:XP_004365611.2 hypothetical protein CAOG_00740 [Capsaspora owczarzaki ATCC 30864]
MEDIVKTSTDWICNAMTASSVSQSRNENACRDGECAASLAATLDLALLQHALQIVAVVEDGSRAVLWAVVERALRFTTMAESQLFASTVFHPGNRDGSEHAQDWTELVLGSCRARVESATTSSLSGHPPRLALRIARAGAWVDVADHSKVLSSTHQIYAPKPVENPRRRNALTIEFNQLIFRRLLLPQFPKRIQHLHHAPNLVNRGCYCRLWAVPVEIGNLQHLLSLNLSDNSLQSLPDEIGRLTNLEELFLHYNALESLPSSITKLTKLAELRLKNNRLSQLPVDMGQWKNLRILIVTNNRLESLPDSIGELQLLQELALHSNRIRTVPASFANLKNLSTLYFGENPLVELPADFGRLVELVECDFSRCSLTTLPDSVSNLSKLVRLWVSDNNLRDLPNRWISMVSLSDLFVSGNQIAHVPYQLSQLHLSTLNLHSNPLSHPQHESLRDFEAIAVGVPSLFELAARKVHSQYETTWHQLPLPLDVLEYLGQARVCSWCNQPFFQFWWSRLEFCDVAFNSHIPVSMELCSLGHLREIQRTTPNRSTNRADRNVFQGPFI